MSGSSSRSGEGEAELANIEPFKTVLSGNREAMAKFKMPDLEMIVATLTGMSVDEVNNLQRFGMERVAKVESLQEIIAEMTEDDGPARE